MYEHPAISLHYLAVGKPFHRPTTQIMFFFFNLGPPFGASKVACRGGAASNSHGMSMGAG